MALVQHHIAAVRMPSCGTCIAHDVNPRAYLHLVTKLIVRGWPQSKLAELLPDALRRAHPAIALLPPDEDNLLLAG